MINKTCEICGIQFQVKPYRAKTARFCSLRCSAKWKISTRTMPHAHKIGNTFRKGKRPTNAFTSEQVRGKGNPRWVESIKLSCSNCKNTFEIKPWIMRQNRTKTGHKFCSSKCSKEFMRGPNDPRYVGGPKTYRGRGWLEARKKAVIRDMGTCQDCGRLIGNSIPVHHIKPFRDFSTAEEANRLENLICYCQSCHMKMESRLPSLPALVQSRSKPHPSRSQ